MDNDGKLPSLSILKSQRSLNYLRYPFKKGTDLRSDQWAPQKGYERHPQIGISVNALMNNRLLITFIFLNKSSVLRGCVLIEWGMYLSEGAI